MSSLNGPCLKQVAYIPSLSTFYILIKHFFQFFIACFCNLHFKKMDEGGDEKQEY